MQQKGEREIMTNGECCRYIRTYSELEGLQHACTLVYCAASTPQGVLAQLRREQGGRVSFFNHYAWFIRIFFVT